MLKNMKQYNISFLRHARRAANSEKNHLQKCVTLPKPITLNLPGGKGRWAHKADNLTAICEPIA
jgi:hypothetical protein